MGKKPAATRSNVAETADALTLERGAPQHVAIADLRRRLSDPDGVLQRFFEEWLADRTGGLPPEAMKAIESVLRAAWEARQAVKLPTAAPSPAPDRARPAIRQRGRPPAAPRHQPAPRSFLATAAVEEAELRRLRQAKSRPEAEVGSARSAAPPAGKVHDLASAAGRLCAAIEGSARPGAPVRRRVSPEDWNNAGNKEFARAVAVWLCDLGRPVKTLEIYGFLKAKFNVFSPKPENTVLLMLAGSRIARTRDEWSFRTVEKPTRARDGDSFEKLFFAAAMETLMNEGRLMTAPEIEDRHGQARDLFRRGWLGDALRRAAERSSGVAKEGESYRWIGPGPELGF